MSINGSVASFLPFTINGLTDASFSNSNLGVATATALTLTSATPLRLARFDLDKNLVSASVDETGVAVLTSNVFDGTQTMKPGHTTNINNVFETTIIPNPPFDASSFTTSGIAGYTPPLGTITGPVAGEFSISQTANDRSIMKIDGFAPIAGRKYVYTFTIRIINAPEAYVSVEQSGVQRSNTIIQIGVDNEIISDTFTFDPVSGPIVFKIYTGSLDPWTATWSSFSLGYYEASINAPINNPLVANTISTNTISTEFLSLPSTSSNSESWTIYAVSTMNNQSTLGGIIFQEATLGVGAYISGGIVGAKSFHFDTLSGNAGKVVVTNADQVMSTSINAGQLSFITALTSQAAGVDQVNIFTANQVASPGVQFIQPYNATTLNISTLVNRATMDAAIAAIPAANILPLNNIFTGTNTFNSTLTTAEGLTTNINGALSTSLVDLGFTSASFTTAGITGAYTPPLGTITNPSGSTYQITQTAQGRSIMAISGFVPAVGITYIFEFNINCTIGTAIINVEQNGILRSPQFYQLSTGFNIVRGSFTYDGTPNTVVFKIFTGVASWNAQWDSFTLSQYSVGLNANMNCLTVDNRITQRYNALPGNISTLVNRATMDSAISAIPIPPSILPLNNIFTGTNTFNNTVQVSGVGVNLGVSLGSIIKTTATAGSLVQLTGGGAGNSPYLEFLFGGNSRGYLGNASAVDLDLVAQNGAKLNFYTQGTSRMTIDTAGIITMRPTANPITIGSDGVIKWSNPNGSQSHWGYPSGGGSDNYIRGTATYIDTPVGMSAIPQNGNASIASQVAVFDGNTLKKSQAVNKLVYFNNNVAWGGGVNMTYAFYIYNTACSVQFWGKNSGFYSGAGMMQTMIRVYSQVQGTYQYYPINAFVNVGYNHFTVPLNYAANFGATGWYDIYVYSTSGWITDGNDQLTIGVTILPANGF